MLWQIPGFAEALPVGSGDSPDYVVVAFVPGTGIFQVTNKVRVAGAATWIISTVASKAWPILRLCHWTVRPGF